MNPATLIPTPDTIPVGWGWFHILLTLTFFLHILAMNVMLGTVIIAFVQGLGTKDKYLPLNQEIAKKLPYTIALAVNLGVAPLLFAQVIFGHFLYVSSLLMAVFWLSIVALLIIAYYSAYIFWYRYQDMQAGRIFTTGLTMVSLLAIGFFLSNNMTMMLHPQSWTRYFEHPDGFLLNFGDPTLIPRYLHMVVSAIAVGGLTIALWYTYQASRGQKESSRWIKYGCTWFAGATIANYGLGFWFFGVLPHGVIVPSTLVGGLFSFFLVLAVITGAISIIQALRYQPLQALWYTLGTILLMVFMRDLLRVAYLKPWFSLSDLQVESSWSPFLVFLLSFIGGLVLVGWMLRTTYIGMHDKELRS
ncbi:MAG TPA: hypothetical protein ENK84_00250 [Desulfobulbus sp.]|nr:hypothetical protein [Desulfobulbus sp.]